jgi:hypothetical protein
VWDSSGFAKNRGRRPNREVARRLLSAVVTQAKGPGVRYRMSSSALTATLIQAWASMTSLRRKDDAPPPR